MSSVLVVVVVMMAQEIMTSRPHWNAIHKVARLGVRSHGGLWWYVRNVLPK